jgi:hypothetical protein
MRLAVLSNPMASKLEATKMVSKLTISKNDLEALLNTIDAINSLPEDATMFESRLLSDWKIPSTMSVFFTPDSVKVDNNSRLCADVMKRSGYDEKIDLLKYPEFCEVIDKIFGLYKNTADYSTPISDLRKKVTIQDVYPRMIGPEDSLHWDGKEYFIPLDLDVQVGIKSSYFNSDIDQVMEEFVLAIPTFFRRGN